MRKKEFGLYQFLTHDLGRFRPDFCPSGFVLGLECVNWVGYVREFEQKGVREALSD